MSSQTANSVWLCDFSALCIRLGSSGHHARLYDPKHIRKIGGLRVQKKKATYFSKWSKYQFRKSNYAIYERNPQILYDRGIELFAIQDSFSRFIVGYSLKSNPTNEYTNYLYWFDVVPTFERAFNRYGLPFELISDSYLLRLRCHSGKYLRSKNIELTNAAHPSMLGSVDSFFLRLQYEMRTSLTPKNIARYVSYWNYQRPHSALSGYPPSCAFLCGSEERFRAFVENAKNEDRRTLLSEIRDTILSNYP